MHILSSHMFITMLLKWLPKYIITNKTSPIALVYFHQSETTTVIRLIIVSCAQSAPVVQCHHDTLIGPKALLSYCCDIWGNVCTANVHCVTVVKKVITFICGVGRLHHTNPLLYRRIHILQLYRYFKN